MPLSSLPWDLRCTHPPPFRTRVKSHAGNTEDEEKGRGQVRKLRKGLETFVILGMGVRPEGSPPAVYSQFNAFRLATSEC